MNSSIFLITTVLFSIAAFARAAPALVTEDMCKSRLHLSCHLMPTTSETSPGNPSKVQGSLTLAPYYRDNQCFTRVKGHIDGLGDSTPHGFHIHELGDLAAPDGTSTGGHYNPYGNDHALPSEGQRKDFHVGDLGNLFPSDKGVATLDTLYEDPIDTCMLVGRSIIVHAKEDGGKAEQPTGDAGARVAVCVLGRM